MILRHVAVVSETASISFSELSRVSAALQKQAIRDVGPVWGIQSTVDAFGRLEDVPIGTWPIIIEDNINVPGAAGIHEDDDGQPFALVTAGNGWSLTASHELVEMLVDPFGRRLTEGQSPKPGQGRVQFLIEPCDPSEAVQFAYLINGVTVSDFYTPKYFSTVFNPADRYSHTGAIQRPRQVLKGGYLSWHDPVTDHWFQETFFTGNAPKFRDLGRLTVSAKSFRRQIYDVTHQAFEARRPKGRQITTAKQALVASADSTESKAYQWREKIAALKGAKA
jgi:hypothetical protein